MMNECQKCLQLFDSGHVMSRVGNFSVEEKNPTGAGRAEFSCERGAILIKPNSSPPLWALKERKCADGAFLTFDDSGAHLHLVELKSRLDVGTWVKTRAQLTGMFLASIAVARILNIRDFVSVTCYVAMKAQAVSTSETSSPVFLKSSVGGSGSIGGIEDWQNGSVRLPYETNASLVTGQRDPAGNVFFGSV